MKPHIKCLLVPTIILIAGDPRPTFAQTRPVLRVRVDQAWVQGNGWVTSGCTLNFTECDYCSRESAEFYGDAVRENRPVECVVETPQPPSFYWGAGYHERGTMFGLGQASFDGFCTSTLRSYANADPTWFYELPIGTPHAIHWSEYATREGFVVNGEVIPESAFDTIAIEEARPDGCTIVLYTRADHNRDGEVSVQDVFAFLGCWFGCDAAADQTADGAVSVEDLLAFVSAWMR